MNITNYMRLECFEKDVETFKAKEEIEELMKSMKSMNLDELEDLLDEKLNNNDSGKYFILAILRDLFISYKKLGDSDLILELGGCKNNCHQNACKVFNLRGKNSGKDFAFVIEKSSNRISGIHICPSFIDSKNVKRPADNDLYYEALKQDNEMKKKGKNNWDDDVVKKALERARKFI